MQKIVITGGAGFIGSHVVRRFVKNYQDYTIVNLDKLTYAGNLANLKDIEHLPNYRFVKGDITDAAFINQLFETEQPDAVIHLAGNADHGLATREPWRDVQATAVLGARLLSSVRARRIVMLSSAAVYAGLAGAVGPELSVQPVMPYALSKLYMEGFVRSRVADGAADGAVVIRLYNAFGPGERPTRLVPAVVAAMRSGTDFRLTGAPDSLSDPVHVDDVVAALIAAVLATVSGTWDLCGGDPHPLPDQVVRIADALDDVPPIVDLAPDTSQTPIMFHSDPHPLADALRIPLPRSFKEGVQAYAREAGWLPADIAG